MSDKPIEHDCSGNWICKTNRIRICEVCGMIECYKKEGNK